MTAMVVAEQCLHDEHGNNGTNGEHVSQET